MFRYKILLGVFTAAFALFSLFVKSASAQTPTLEFVKQVMVESAIDVDIQEDRAYVAAGAGGVSTIDISDPANAYEVGSPYDPEGRVFYSVDASGEYVYATSVEYATNRFYILKINLTTGLTEEFTSQNYPGAGREILKVDNYVYIASGGLPIFDVSAPGDPIFPQGFENTAYLDLKVRGNTLYAAQETSFDIIDITNRTAPVLVNRFVVTGIGSARGMDVDENYAYLAVGHPGIAVINLSDATFVKWLDTFEYPWDVAVENGYAFVAQGIHGISAVDLQTDTEVAIYDTPGSADRLTVSGNYVYVADGEGGLVILRFTGFGTGLPVPSFSQIDPGWAGDIYDSADTLSLDCEIYGGPTISACGCAVTSAAMLLKYYKVDYSPDGFPTTPRTLNDWLTKNDGYSYGYVLWPSVAAYALRANQQFDETQQKIKFTGFSVANDFGILENELANDRPVIVKVPNHFVVAKGIDGTGYLINDPRWETKKTLQAYGNSFERLTMFEKANTDLSNLYITAPTTTELFLVDSLGRRVGKDPITGIVYSEIPDSYYGAESVIVDTSFDPPPSVEGKGVVTLFVINPIQDTFRLIAHGPGEKVQFSIAGYDRNGEISVQDLQPGSAGSYEVSYSPDGGPIGVVKKVEIDVKPKSEGNILHLIKQGILPIAILTTPDFDVHSVDTLTIKAGPGQATPFPKKALKIDVDKDGDKDLLFLFKINNLRLQRTDTKLCLWGRTIDGIAIQGCDEIAIQRRGRPDLDIIEILKFLTSF